MTTAGTFTLFSKNKNRINTFDVAAATVKLALVSSVWTPDFSVTGNSLWANMSANEIAAGTGYTAGGQTLATPASVAIAGGYKLNTAAPAAWTASGGGIAAHRYYVMYLLGTVWGMVNPVIGFFNGDATLIDIPLTTTGNTLTPAMPASGWFDQT